jgi:hypothetical protein
VDSKLKPQSISLSQVSGVMLCLKIKGVPFEWHSFCGLAHFCGVDLYPITNERCSEKEPFLNNSKKHPLLKNILLFSPFGSG